MLNLIICFMFGMGVGMFLAIVVTCVGGGNHEEEIYKEGYDRGHMDGMREARYIFREDKKE